MAMNAPWFGRDTVIHRELGDESSTHPRATTPAYLSVMEQIVEVDTFRTGQAMEERKLRARLSISRFP